MSIPLSPLMLYCSLVLQTIEARLRTKKGVHSARVSILAGLAVVEYTPFVVRAVRVEGTSATLKIDPSEGP